MKTPLLTLAALLVMACSSPAQITFPAAGSNVYYNVPLSVCWSMNGGADVLGFLTFSYQGYSTNAFAGQQNITAPGCYNFTPTQTGTLYVWGQFVRCTNGCGTPPDTFQASYPIVNNSVFGWVDQATDPNGNAAFVQGVPMTVRGWAVDAAYGGPVTSVTILVDGVSVGTATLGISRPDVAAAYNNPLYTNSGYTMQVPTAALSVGTHTVTASAVGFTSDSGTLWGTRAVTLTALSMGSKTTQTFSSSGLPTDTYGSAPGGYTNLAVGMPARMNTTLAVPAQCVTVPRVASNAVDGNTDGMVCDGSVAITNNSEPNDWWEVDLGQSADIQEIAIWNRTDCCQDRLGDYWVFVSNTPFADTDTPTTLSANPNVWNNHQTTYPNPETTIPVGGVAGEYVRVQLTGQNWLELAEVQVMGAFDGGGKPASIPITKSVKLRSGKTAQIARGDMIHIGDLQYQFSGSGPWTYQYTFDNSNVAIVRIGDLHDLSLGRVDSSQPKRWFGGGDTGWNALDNSEYSTSAVYSLTSTKSPGLQPMFFQSDVLGTVAMANGGALAGLPMGERTEDNIAIARAGGLFGNSVKRYVMGPVFDAGVDQKTVLARVKVWVNQYGFAFLAPLLKDDGSLADCLPSNQLEQDIVQALHLVLP